MALDEYAPQPKPPVFLKNYVGSDGITAVGTLDGKTLLIAADDAPAPQATQQSTTAVLATDYSDIDFLCSESANGVTVNEGELTYVLWDGIRFIQASLNVPETEITLVAQESTQYIHLIVRLITVDEPASIVEAPYIEHVISENDGTLHTLADIIAWQDPETPEYIVSDEETIVEVPGAGDDDVFFTCLLASINTANGLRVHHCGQINLSQGYYGKILDP
jgi:hypothetical protein